jgi:hypothetical protein
MNLNIKKLEKAHNVIIYPSMTGNEAAEGPMNPEDTFIIWSYEM